LKFLLTLWAVFFILTQQQLLAQDSTLVKKAADSAALPKPGVLPGNSVPEIGPLFSYSSSYKPPRANKARVWAVAGFNVAAYSGTLVALNKYWYADYPRRSLHSFNDSKEWMQVDKMGHAFSAYLEGKYSMELWRWTGISRKHQIWLGGLSGAVYQTAIEFLDGTSAQWGWSWTDFSANLAGSGLLIGQELAWNEQRIQFKVSYRTQQYDPAVLTRAHDLYGKGGPERFLKDYNGQTHWLSVNLKSFMPESKWPAWLNIAVGHGATGMLGGFENIWKDKNGVEINRTDILRQRQWYLAPDIDFTKIKTNKKLVRYFLQFINLFKMPAPGLELTGGKLKLKGLVF
jgi:uncharacterized protein YfiM (DUF2279 family)